MHKTLATALLTAGILSTTATHADGLKFFPGLQSGFKFEPSLALTVGATAAPAARDSVLASYGLDFNMNCGLIQTPDNRIRTHIQLNRIDQSNVTATSVELSPRYTLPIGGGFAVGAGPALAWVNADTGAGSQNLFGYGAVAGVSFRKAHYYSGIDLRYLNTSERERTGLEQWGVQAKVGINF